jgi:hypothetical protein
MPGTEPKKTRRAPEGHIGFLDAMVRRFEHHVELQKDRSKIEPWCGDYWAEGHFARELLEVLVRLPEIPYQDLQEGVSRLEAMIPEPHKPREQRVLLRMHQTIRRLQQFIREWGEFPRIAFALSFGLRMMYRQLGPRDTIYSLEHVTEAVCKAIVYQAKSRSGINERFKEHILNHLNVCWQATKEEPRIQLVIHAAMCDVAGETLPNPTSK